MSTFCTVLAAQNAFSGPEGGAVVPFVSLSATLEKSINFVCGTAMSTLDARTETPASDESSALLHHFLMRTLDCIFLAEVHGAPQ